MARISERTQRGVALIVSLVLLLVVTILSLSAVKFSTQALRVATNFEYRVAAFETATSVVDAAISDPGNTPVTDATGFVACTSASLPNCSGSGIALITLPNSYLATDVSSSYVTVRVSRLGAGNVPRRGGYELDTFSAAQFSVEAVYDHNAAGDGRGSSQVAEGLLLVYPKM